MTTSMIRLHVAVHELEDDTGLPIYQQIKIRQKRASYSKQAHVCELLAQNKHTNNHDWPNPSGI